MYESSFCVHTCVVFDLWDHVSKQYESNLGRGMFDVHNEHLSHHSEHYRIIVLHVRFYCSILSNVSNLCKHQVMSLCKLANALIRLGVYSPFVQVSLIWDFIFFFHIQLAYISSRTRSWEHIHLVAVGGMGQGLDRHDVISAFRTSHLEHMLWG